MKAKELYIKKDYISLKEYLLSEEEKRQLNEEEKSLLAFCFVFLKEFKKGFSILKDQLLKYPHNYITSHNLAFCFYLTNGKRDSSYYAKRACKLKDDCLMSNYLKAVLEKDKDESTLFYKKVLKIESQFAPAVNDLAILEYAIDKKQCIDLLLSLKNKDSVILHNIIVFYLKDKKYRESLRYLTDFKFSYKNDYILSFLYYLLNDFENSKKHLKRILDYDCYDFIALNNIVFILKEQNFDYQIYKYSLQILGKEEKNTWDYSNINFQFYNRNDIFIPFKKMESDNNNFEKIKGSLSILKHYAKHCSPKKIKKIKEVLSFILKKRINTLIKT